MNEIIAYNVGVWLAQAGKPLPSFLTMPLAGLNVILTPDQLEARKVLGSDRWARFVGQGHGAGTRETGR